MEVCRKHRKGSCSAHMKFEIMKVSGAYSRFYFGKRRFRMSSSQSQTVSANERLILVLNCGRFYLDLPGENPRSGTPGKALKNHFSYSHLYFGFLYLIMLVTFLVTQQNIVDSKAFAWSLTLNLECRRCYPVHFLRVANILLQLLRCYN